MEPEGMRRIFGRSLERYNVKYAYYISDGDSKTYSELLELDPYPGLKIQKQEDINHFQKRMGGNLRRLKKKLGKNVLSDGKSIGGSGRLTDAFITSLSMYYGMALRTNQDSVQNMYKSVWATFYHYSSTDEDPQHFYCPEGETSWCQWQRAAQRNELDSFRHKKVIPGPVMEAVKPIYEALTKAELLERCLGAKSQNVNEAFNQLVWKLCPKSHNTGHMIVKIAVYSVVGQFNDGAQSKRKIMEALQLHVGNFARTCLEEEDAARIKDADIKQQAATLEARRAKKTSCQNHGEKPAQGLHAWIG